MNKIVLQTSVERMDHSKNSAYVIDYPSRKSSKIDSNLIGHIYMHRHIHAHTHTHTYNF